MHITIINGPNLNLLGTREPEIYGSKSFETFLTELQQRFPDTVLEYYQSNHEGALIDKLQDCKGKTAGIIFNGAGYTHTSIALADTIKAIDVPVVEVHISNIHAREPYRQHSYTAANARGIISGLGLEGYALAISWFRQTLTP
ncbi:type II 3-dehydroquinate dehydratase [Taibaiella chishuiensis]|uniref:3-dehydroquinate dehydratase n=1 Tax=Taibaiella chishuiensis TaxID=1434707 RepID=A0A2P8CNP0_9BACT|nr:type II 3-dehydroquinate dehydratase [Taibaiella chishuiensis]PSK86571.1 3-dehydroquinate dehydratase [Taibaiella chishuiensis]